MSVYKVYGIIFHLKLSFICSSSLLLHHEEVWKAKLFEVSWPPFTIMLRVLSADTTLLRTCLADAIVFVGHVAMFVFCAKYCLCHSTNCHCGKERDRGIHNVGPIPLLHFSSLSALSSQLSQRRMHPLWLFFKTTAEGKLTLPALALTPIQECRYSLHSLVLPLPSLKGAYYTLPRSHPTSVC